ncbi:UDP-2,3-diacylglucosamine diphosphatase LpxI [Parvibaculum sp.]|uniref:LpxI family protein n=1 Tax=Parvibaculum sp. TaxID=2024848 RepID=UPI000C8DC2CD|nr:UDP-2,3-diacylglucosamine diphosphatase LpxI [Parvibaculum sp.]MAB13975.1 UDP-2,3-diacylglucosamine pyrophosphatase [Parvibaculum sp.]
MTASQSSGASSSRLPKLAIVAGAGPLPVSLAKAALAEGREVFIIGIEGFAGSEIEAFPHAWNRLGAMGKFIRLLKDNRCEEMVLIGAVTRPDLRKLSLDMTAIRLLPKLRSWMKQGDDGLLRGLGGYIQDETGVRIVGAHEISGGLLAPEGALTKLVPDDSQKSDIAVAMNAARAIGALDIGQGAVACRGIVLALEAAEGTDAMLERVANLPEHLHGSETAREGGLVKLPKPGQERRMDLPTIGVRTVENAAAAGLAGIAVEGGGALVDDIDAMTEAANRLGLFVVGLPSAETRADTR